MNWDAIGAIGEIIGAAGVIFSLVYLSIQIKSQSSATRAATVQAFSDSQMTIMSELIGNAEIWEKMLAGEPLAEGKELRIGILLFNMIMIENENTYFQHKSGYLNDTHWDGRLKNIENLVRLPIYSSWRNSFGAKTRDGDYITILDETKISIEEDDT